MRLAMPIQARNAGCAQQSFVPYGFLQDGPAIEGTVHAACRPGLAPRAGPPAP